MSGRPSRRAHGRPLPDGPAPFTTLVELTFEKRRVEHWIRFGRKAYEQILDRRHSVVGFAPESIFAFVRWAAAEHGTIISRIDIVRAIGRGEPFQTLPFVRPGGEILLRLDGWPKVQRALHGGLRPQGLPDCAVAQPNRARLWAEQRDPRQLPCARQLRDQ
ncbi:DUF2840 domain-containing protein [Brucella intermedia]|uniref:DUF2840 domain-containing protein n=1 Tax=Brucella intermedia TaxID=94625 RepID=UPI001FFE6265|nr:DUF2840 domain-containing protein [Brucella intermedia]